MEAAQWISSREEISMTAQNNRLAKKKISRNEKALLVCAKIQKNLSFKLWDKRVR